MSFKTKNAETIGGFWDPLCADFQQREADLEIKIDA